MQIEYGASRSSTCMASASRLGSAAIAAAEEEGARAARRQHSGTGAREAGVPDMNSAGEAGVLDLNRRRKRETVDRPPHQRPKHLSRGDKKNT
jgi:hypothetical protein